MTATQPHTRISGCARRRAKAIARRDNVTALTHRREDAAFYEHGTIPASATAVTICSCGARAFARGEHPDLSDFDASHAYCDEAAS